jgi:hypothetical protein
MLERQYCCGRLEVRVVVHHSEVMSGGESRGQQVMTCTDAQVVHHRASRVVPNGPHDRPATNSAARRQRCSSRDRLGADQTSDVSDDPSLTSSVHR